jgi:hypothetical protein
MSRRNMQIGLIKALGGGFDATKADLVVPTDDAPMAQARQSAQASLASEAKPAAAN